MSHVLHEMDGRFNSTIVWFIDWKLEVRRNAGVPDLPSEEAAVDVIYILVRRISPSEVSDYTCKLASISEESLP